MRPCGRSTPRRGVKGTDAQQAADPSAIKAKSAQEVMEEGECQTCKERTYQDGSARGGALDGLGLIRALGLGGAAGVGRAIDAVGGPGAHGGKAKAPELAGLKGTDAQQAADPSAIEAKSAQEVMEEGLCGPAGGPHRGGALDGLGLIRALGLGGAAGGGRGWTCKGRWPPA